MDLAATQQNLKSLLEAFFSKENSYTNAISGTITTRERNATIVKQREEHMGKAGGATGPAGLCERISVGTGKRRRRYEGT